MNRGFGFTLDSNGILRDLKTSCGVTVAFNPESTNPHPTPIGFIGLWDTGATGTVIGIVTKIIPSKLKQLLIFVIVMCKSQTVITKSVNKSEGLMKFECLNTTCKKVLFEAKLSTYDVVKIKCKACKTWNTFELQ